MPMKLRAASSRILKLLITAILLVLVFRSADPAAIRHNLSRLDLPLISLLLCAYWGAQMACAQRWRLLARSLGIGGSYGSFLRLYFAGMFFGIGATSVGGDIIKAQGAARNAGASFGLGLASVILDRGAGLVTLLVFGTIAVFLRPIAWRGVPLPAVYAAGWAALAVLLLLVRRSGATGNAGAGGRLSVLRQAFAVIRSSGRTAAALVAISLANALVVLEIVHRLCTATGAAPERLALWTVVPIVELLTLLPVSVSGLGIREWAYTDSLALYGFPRESGLTVALALSALVLVRNLAGIFFIGAVPSPIPSCEDTRR